MQEVELEKKKCYNKKIVFFTMAMNKGGAERVISILCNHGLGEGNEMHIVTCLQGDSQYELKKSVIRHPGFLSFDEYKAKGKIKTLPQLCKKYKDTMKQIDPDVIISFLPEPCFIAELCKKQVGKPLIGSERGNPYERYRSRIYHFLTTWLYPKSDGFVFQTEGAKEYFNEKLQRKSDVIGNPIAIVDGLKWEPKNRKKEIVSVGRFTYEKNYPLLLKAFRRITEKKEDYILKIYGKVDESLGLRRLAEELGIVEKVLFMGQVDDILERIKDASVFVLSSVSEGMPNALMEAMALGLPVVATDCPPGGPRQLIQNGENGLLVENQNEAALADAVLKILSDENLSQKLSKNARKITEEYSKEKICAQWSSYILKVIKENA